MIHFVAIIDALLGFYVACPKCKKIQHFKGKKKGDSVTCIRCGLHFELK